MSWWSIGQSALGGAVAWEIAVRALGHPAPFFASVAAIVCLSISVLNRLRRVGELAIGVALGVGLGDLLVHRIGHGGWQMGLVVLIAMTVALLLDGGALIDELTGALFTLPGALLDPGGEGERRAVAALTTLADRLDPLGLAARSMSATVVVAQVRSAVVDLLQVPGLSADDARAALKA